jgi:23S rRNA (cytidine1920-2'-O)/16S rRNA (cytidine1409-2'-O)-methyltransferase
MRKRRADLLLIELGLVESRALAQRLVMAGKVRADGQVIPKPASLIPEGAEIVIETGPKYVSRGGEKLEEAIHSFNFDLNGKVCADVGASTGGFTDCLLQFGASRVYAIDVGKGILHWKLRQDPRVVVLEKTNARLVEHLPEPVHLVTVDVSFISVKTILPVIRGWFHPEGGDVIVLIKPQFEAGRSQVKRGEGVIRDPEVHRQVLFDVLNSMQQNGYRVQRLIRSPLLGPKGNMEFLVSLAYPGQGFAEILKLISEVLDLPPQS